MTIADDLRPLPHYFTHTDQSVAEKRNGDFKIVNPCEFNFVCAPSEQELALFVSWQMRNVKRKIVFHGNSFEQLDVLAAVALKFKPWMFCWQCQSNGSQEFTATLEDIEFFISQGKYSLK